MANRRSVVDIVQSALKNVKFDGTHKYNDLEEFIELGDYANSLIRDSDKYFLFICLKSKLFGDVGKHTRGRKIEDWESLKKILKLLYKRNRSIDEIKEAFNYYRQPLYFNLNDSEIPTKPLTAAFYQEIDIKNSEPLNTFFDTTTELNENNHNTNLSPQNPDNKTQNNENKIITTRICLQKRI